MRARVGRDEEPKTLDTARLGLLLRARRAGLQSFPFIPPMATRPGALTGATLLLAAALVALWRALQG